MPIFLKQHGAERTFRFFLLGDHLERLIGHLLVAALAQAVVVVDLGGLLVGGLVVFLTQQGHCTQGVVHASGSVYPRPQPEHHIADGHRAVVAGHFL